MLMQTITHFNWVDIFILVVFLRICYIGLKTGFPAELFKLAGTILAVYISLHYYTGISDLFRDKVKINLKVMPLEFVDFISFVVFASLSYAIFVALRSVLARMIKMEAVPQLNKWGGVILSVFRGFLLTGLLIFALVISSVTYFKNSVKKSNLGSRMVLLAPNTYTWIWNNIMSKFMAHEKLNPTLQEVQDNL